MANSPGQEASLKACRSCNNDRISNLPDALIRRILSFLPTKQAVATSVLSNRWVWLWTLVPTLYLEDSNRSGIDEQAKMKFVHFVYRVLLLNKAASLEKFRLNCNQIYGQSFINTWIRSAIDRDLQEVDILVSEIANDDLVKIPSGLFLMKTLKVLKLHGGIMVDVTVSVCLPSLRTLHLLHVNYANVESVRWIISGCVSLEELRIDAKNSKKNTVNFIISSPTLNSLSLSFSFFVGVKIEISAPALKYLNFKSLSLIKPHSFKVENFPCLIEANIYFVFWPGIQLFTALNAAKYLKLVGDPASLGRNASPLFVNLTKLELSGVLNWPVVSFLLERSPKLETLVVHRGVFRDGHRWTQPKKVPTCFLSSLSRACFENFEGLEEELKMVEYF
ncbi:hypothetical protein PTKIN_Ptkin14bG0122700 [Pterospermum kingtungense]